MSSSHPSAPTDQQPQPQEAPKPTLTKSQSQRARQTAKAIIYSVVATVLLVVAWLALNPTEDMSYSPDIDVEATASEAAVVAEFDPIVPDVPEDWSANYARWNSPAANEHPYWEVGYLTDDEQFFGFAQSATESDLWVNEQVRNGDHVGETTILGYTFDVYVPEDGHTYLAGRIPDPVAEGHEVAFVVSGSVADEDLAQLTAEIITDRETAVATR